MICLNDKSEPVSIDPQNVYFAFADGRLSYDCISCGAQCCRGKGYLLNIETPTELHAQLKETPDLHIFFKFDASKINSSALGVFNMEPECFFLTQDNTCRIHQNMGYEAKPETCRLFPFNNIIRVGGHLVVKPHSGICPLQISESEVADGKSSHTNLLRSIQLRGISAEIPEYKSTKELSIEVYPVNCTETAIE